MRLLRAHHIKNLIAAVDVFLSRQAASPRGGRPVILHPNEVISLLIFSTTVTPQRTLKDMSGLQ